MKARLLLVVFLVALVQAGAVASAQEGIKIGVDTPLTGSGATPGHLLLWGFQIAMDEVNAKGGILGKQIIPVVRDDESQVQKSITNIKEFVYGEKVTAVFGAVNSGNAMAFIPILQQERIPIVIPVATATKITLLYQNEPKNYIFRSGLPDNGQVQRLVSWAVKKFKKIGLAVDSTGYGQFGQENLVEALKKQNVVPAEIVKFNMGDTDMTSQLGKLKAAGCDGVAVYTLGPEIANLFRSAEKIDYHPKFFGPWTFFHNEVGDLPARLSDGAVGVLSSTAQDSDKARELDRKMRERYVKQGFYPFTFVAVSYEGAMLLFNAIAKAGSLDGEKIRDALENTENFQGLSKTFPKPFSKTKHELYGPDDMFLSVWKNGQPIQLKD